MVLSFVIIYHFHLFASLIQRCSGERMVPEINLCCSHAKHVLMPLSHLPGPEVPVSWLSLVLNILPPTQPPSLSGWKHREVLQEETTPASGWVLSADWACVLPASGSSCVCTTTVCALASECPPLCPCCGSVSPICIHMPTCLYMPTCQ